MRDFNYLEDIWVWNSEPGQPFNMHRGVFISRTDSGTIVAACEGALINEEWTHAIKACKAPDWGLVPMEEHKKPEVKAGDLAYVNGGCSLRMVLGVNPGVFCKYKCECIHPDSDYLEWDSAVLHTTSEDLEFMCEEAQALSDIRAVKPKVGDTVLAWDLFEDKPKVLGVIDKIDCPAIDCIPYRVLVNDSNNTEWFSDVEVVNNSAEIEPKIGDEVLAWNNGDTGRHIGIYVNHTGSDNRPYQVKCDPYQGFFENIKLHVNNAPTVEDHLDRALAIFDEGGSKSDTLANLLDMTLEGMKISKLNAELEGDIMTAISISSEIADLNSSLRDIRNGV